MKTPGTGLEAHAGSIQPALIFIPDISGFTYFVTETPILHSKDLIAELLEAVIDANPLGLEISEIEGDAILFYRLGPPPPVNELAAQVTAIIQSFERVLREYERNRICCCGSCSMAHQLAIKMIAHHGPVTVMLVDDFVKLLGPAVIAAHRLLKNPVKDRQYALLTADLLGAQADGDGRRLIEERWPAGGAEYEGLGPIGFHYRSFPPEKRTALPSAWPPETWDKGPALVSLTVDTPMDWTHHVLTDLELASRHGEIRNRLEEPRRIHRVGSLHTRASRSATLQLRTVANCVEEGRIRYAEEVAGASRGPRALFEILPFGTRCELRVSLSAGAGDAMQNLYSRYARQIKRVSEREYRAADWAAGVF